LVGERPAYFNIGGVLSTRFPAMAQIAQMWMDKPLNYRYWRAICSIIETITPIPANRFMDYSAGVDVGSSWITHYLTEAPTPVIDKIFPKDANGKNIIEPNGKYRINPIEDAKFSKQIEGLKNSKNDIERKKGANIEELYNILKTFDANKKAFSDTTVAFADANAIRIAESLFQQRDAIAKLTTAYEAGKRQIAPYLKVEPVVIPGQGSIFFVNGSVSNRLDGDKVLAGLTKIAKVSPDIAKALLKRWSNVRTMSQYVKISNKDNITTGV
jgi:hypothetical protein